MEELVKLVSEKTGIPAETARTAVQTVVNFLKEKLPAPIASQLDGVLSNPNLGGQVDDALKGLGGLLGRR